MYRQRTLEAFFKKANGQFPVLLVTGARQVGKTTFLQHMRTKERTYVSLDDPGLRNLATSDPALFMQRFPSPLLIDEIQYAPQLLPYIKMAVDRNRKPGMFWLTGSQQFHIMKGVSESLAGRVGLVSLMGLSKQERFNDKNHTGEFLPLPNQLSARSKKAKPLPVKKLYDIIWRGSLPEIALHDEMDWNLFYSSYIQTYLQRDIRDLANVGDEMTFLRFLRASAARTGQLLNFAELARDADVAPNTAKKWISILQASGIIYLLEPYHSNTTKRMIKAPKLYFLDTGLCSYLTEWSSPATLEAGAMSGPILETWILTELLKSYLHNGKRAPFYFYRDKDKKEIDLLILKDGTIYPLEFKKSASPTRASIRHFSLLQKLDETVGYGGVVCLCEQILPLTEQTTAIPISLL